MDYLSNLKFIVPPPAAGCSHSPRQYRLCVSCCLSMTIQLFAVMRKSLIYSYFLIIAARVLGATIIGKLLIFSGLRVTQI